MTSAAERKRKSRAANPERYSNEKSKSRERMAIIRKRNRYQKMSLELRRLLGGEENARIESRADDHRRSLLRELFASRNLKNVCPDVFENDKVLSGLVSKSELHRIDALVAEYEISLARELMGERGGSPSASVPDDAPKSAPRGAAEKEESRERAAEPKRRSREESKEKTAERKRKSRAELSPDDRQKEKAKSRERMAIFRTRNKAQKHAAYLKGLLNDEDKKEIEARAAAHKHSLLCYWFGSRQLRFSTDVATNEKTLNTFMSKPEMHKIEREVAEFESSLARDKLRRRLPAGGARSLPPLDTVSTSSVITPRKQEVDQKPEDQSNQAPIDCHSAGENSGEEKTNHAKDHPTKAAGHRPALKEESQSQDAYQLAINALLVAAERMASEEEQTRHIEDRVDAVCAAAAFGDASAK